MKEVIARLKEHQSPTPSRWREEAEWRLKNRSWLRHSQHIAVKMLEKMDELSMTQKQLATEIGVSPSRISDYVSGRAEPTLKIARLLCATLGITPAAMLGY